MLIWKNIIKGHPEFSSPYSLFSFILIIINKDENHHWTIPDKIRRTDIFQYFSRKKSNTGRSIFTIHSWSIQKMYWSTCLRIAAPAPWVKRTMGWYYAGRWRSMQAAELFQIWVCCVGNYTDAARDPYTPGKGFGKNIVQHTGRQRKIFPQQYTFDTTRANIAKFSGLKELTCFVKKASTWHSPRRSKAIFIIEALKQVIREKGAENIPLCIITVTNNSGGGQPVSAEYPWSKCCMQSTQYSIVHWCLQGLQRMPTSSSWEKMVYADKPVKEIARELFSYANGCTMSAKKDAFANIGGFLAFTQWRPCKAMP